MVDLLVSIAVMAALIAMTLPSLGRMQEAGRRTQSGSNIRQQGLALQMYAFDRMGELPPSVFQPDTRDRGTTAPHQTPAPHQMVFLRVSRAVATTSTTRGAPSTKPQAFDHSAETTPPERQETRAKTQHAERDHWDALGHLFHREYIAQPGVFYNPSHRSEHTLERYLPRFRGVAGDIVCNYHYRWEPDQRRLSALAPRLTLVADSMRSKSEYNHVVGNNMLKVDGSVAWYADTDGSLYASLADDASVTYANDPSAERAREAVLLGWSRFDHGGPDGLHRPSQDHNDPLGAFFNPSWR